MRMRLAGANRAPRAPGPAEQPGKVSYLCGNDPPAWRREIPTSAKVRCEGVRPRVDLLYSGHPSAPEHDSIVAPGADPKASALPSECVAGVGITAHGASALRTPGEEIRLLTPWLSRVREGGQQESAGGFVLRGPEARDAQVGCQDAPRPPRKVSFQIAPSGARSPLAIDPVLAYATPLGGGRAETDTLEGAIAVDAAGNGYVTGQRGSPNFPTTPGAFQTMP